MQIQGVWGTLRKESLALMGRWLWRFSLELDTLWHSIIHNEYGMDPNGWDCFNRITPSWSLLWKNIIRLLPPFLNHFWFVVGNGESCLAFSHPHLFRLSNEKDARIVDVISSSNGHV